MKKRFTALAVAAMMLAGIMVTPTFAIVIPIKLKRRKKKRRQLRSKR